MGKVQKRFYILLDELERTSTFAFKLNAVGHSFVNPAVKKLTAVYPDQLEVCIRLNSECPPEGSRQLLGGKWYENLSFPQVLLKLPGEKYSMENFPGREVFYFVYPPALVELFRTQGILDGALCWEFPMTPEVELFLHRIHACMDNSLVTGNADKLDLYCYQFLCELLQYRVASGKVPDKERMLMQRIDSFLRLHAFENLDLTEVAARFGFSRSSFFRYWKRYSSISPSRYLLELKLQEAARRLKETRDRVEEIAQDLSLGAPAYMSMVFRKKYKVSPLAYRKKYRMKNVQE